MSDGATTPLDVLEEPRRVRWYVAGAWAGVGVTAAILLFAFTHFAAADDVKERAAAIDVRAAATDTRVGKVEGRTTAIEQREALDVEARRRLEEDFHFQRDQMWEIAKSVGARQLPAPKH